MLKREDPDLYADGGDDVRAAVLDRPPTGEHQVVRRDRPTRGERREALAAEDAAAPRATVRPGAPMIVLENVTKVYAHDVVGLKDVSLNVDKGEWIFLVGPSGSGKSTFIKLLLKE